MTIEQKITLYEKDLYEQRAPKEDVVHLVVFRLASEWYGIDILETREVIKVDQLTYLPSAPAHVAGIINLRGNILSITDLKIIFGLEQEELTDKARIVVIRHEQVETGLLIDEIAEVMVVPLGQIQPTLATIAPDRAGYLKGECKISDQLIGILDAEKILTKGR